MRDHISITSIKKCPGCGLVKSRSAFYVRNNVKRVSASYCKECSKKHVQEWRYRTGRSHPMSEVKESSLYLGVYIAERALSRFFDNIREMPHNNPGYDFICGQGFKIDVKSGVLRCVDHHSDRWEFYVKRNIIADYFLCLAFDNRESLEPQHVWLIPGGIVNHSKGIYITNTLRGLKKWLKYERPLDKVVECCGVIRSVGVV